ncbi:MAG: cytochrome c [Saprospiraceae bacterium]|nr:cytochrome c [Saprospiraceae bacterium]
MRKLLKYLGILLLVIILGLGLLSGWVLFTPLPTHEVKPISIDLPSDSMSMATGQKIVESVCAYCHMGADGKLSGKLFSPESEGFGERFSSNITSHPTLGIGRYSDGELAYLLRTGIKRDGQYAGPYMVFPKYSDADIAAVIAYLRSDAPSLAPSDAQHDGSYSFLAKALFKAGILKPIPFEARTAPSMSDTLAFGEYLATVRYECYGCHSAGFEYNDPLNPEKSKGFFAGGNAVSDPKFNHVISRNITPHPEQGIGKWTKEQFELAARGGVRPDGRILSDAMPRLTRLDPYELDAIWAYLQTVPALPTNQVSSH